MIELTNQTTQTLNPGQAISFNRVLLHTGKGECYNSMLPTSVKLCGHGIYDIEFHGNITGAANAALQLAIVIGNQPLPQTAMNASPAVANNLVNVSAGAYGQNCCCDLDRVSVINSGATPVTIAQNSSLRISRRA